MTASKPRPPQIPPVPLITTGQDWQNWLLHVCPTAHRSPASSSEPMPTAWKALIHIARRQGFAVETGTAGGGEGRTHWRNHRITVPGEPATPQALLALAHQLAHVLLHADQARLDPTGTVPCRGTLWIEAESVAYLIATHLASPTTAIGFPSIPSWAGTDPRSHPETTIHTVTTHIVTAASHVLAAVSNPSVYTPAPQPRLIKPASRPAPAASRDDLIRIHESAARFFYGQLPNSWAPAYLDSRGFNPALQRLWDAGYAPASWDALTSYLRTEGYPDTVIETAGLARRSRRGTLIDVFRDRAILPIHDEDQTIVAFIGRANPRADARTPKYLNSPSTPLYDKSAILFGLGPNRNDLTQGARPILTEGPFDAIAVTAAAPSQYVGLAPCGTALAATQLAALDTVASLRTSGVLVAFDPDEAGQRAAVKAWHLLTPLTDHTEAVTLPPGQDPAQLLHDHGPAFLAQLLADRTHPLADLAIDAEIARWDRWLQHIEGRINALHSASPIIAALPPDQVGRQITRLAHRLDLDHASVTEAVTDALTSLIQTPQPTPQPASNRSAPLPAAAQAPNHPGPCTAARDVSRPIQTSAVRAGAAHPAPARPTSRKAGTASFQTRSSHRRTL